MKKPRSGARRKTLMYFINYDEGTGNERNDEIGRLCLNRHVGVAASTTQVVQNMDAARQ
jgi:hypothetical protein